MVIEFDNGFHLVEIIWRRGQSYWCTYIFVAINYTLRFLYSFFVYYKGKGKGKKSPQAKLNNIHVLKNQNPTNKQG